MEGRILRVIFNKRVDGSYTPKLSLPMKDLKKMGVDLDNREVYYEFNEERQEIIIRKQK